MENEHLPYAVTDKLARTRYYMGGYWTFIATAKDTDGKFSLIEMNIRKGLEAPRHTHTKEDESYHIIEGEILFSVGDEEHLLKAGDFIHLPKGIPHQFKIQSEAVKMLAHLVPAGLEEYFIALSRPADKLEIPDVLPGPPSAEHLQKVAELQSIYGIAGMDNTKIKTG